MSLRFASTRLPNGLRVLLQSDPSWPGFTAQAWVRVGSLDESPTVAGISHVLEHMVFKGSRRWGPAELSRHIENAGGSLNAETSREFTHYHIDLPREGARLAITALAELLFRASLKPREWRLERPVILEEMKRREDDPETLAWDALQEAVYDDPPHRRSVIGTETTVSAITAETLQRFYRDHYTAHRALVVLCGDVPLASLRAWVGSAFRAMPKGTPAPARSLAVVAPVRRVVEHHRRVQHSYTTFAWPTPPATHPDQEALDLVASILGEGRHSRLVRSLREDRQIVWSVSASHYTQQTGGLFAIFLDVDPARRLLAERVLAREWKRLQREPPTRKEIDRARRLMLTAWLQGIETFHHRAAVVGSYALDHQLPRLHRYLSRIQALTPRDLAGVIRRHLAGPWARVAVEP